MHFMTVNWQSVFLHHNELTHRRIAGLTLVSLFYCETVRFFCLYQTCQCCGSPRICIFNYFLYLEVLEQKLT